MSIRLLNLRVLSSLFVFVKRSINVQTNFDLGKQMKLFNDKKQFNKTIELFDKQMKSNTKTFSSLIITQVLKACAHLEDIQRGKTIHQLISSRIKDDSYISASLIHLYMQCSDITNAELLFDKTTKKTLSIYGAMMKGYIKNNQANKAIDIFDEIKNPDEVILILLFNACSQLKTAEALNLIKNVFQQMPKFFYSNQRLLTTLFDAFIKCGDYSNARILFSKIPKSVESYGNLMNGSNRENNPSQTLELFNQMKSDHIKANTIIYLCVIKALSQTGDYSLSQSIIEQIPHHFLVNNQLQNALIDMWGKVGYVDKAKEIFQIIPKPDYIGYTAMINCYGLNGQGNQAIELYRKIPKKFIDEVTHVCVLNACSHSGLVDEARTIFLNTETKTNKIYTAMIDCLSRASFFEEAQKLINEFEHEHSPIIPIYMSLLSGARNEKNSHLSQQVFDRMKILFPEVGKSYPSASVLLANVYAISGDMEKASNIQNQVSKSQVKKEIGLSWTVVNGQYFKFRAHDKSHPRSKEIYALVDQISKRLIEHGHQHDSAWITRPLDEDETVISVLCGHSENLAIAWNLLENSNPSRIQITKNLRVCGNCHQATKLIAALYQCEIIVRDAHRTHHFYKNGQCSCNDYF
ncbi:unnamed protein product [Adineta steineri]|uniref:DYW domain-containing protein n=1 Tax=Adineta steineri TaxID=433720 RepID=A0A813NUB7_9BILA|nr:unnamed protein product [Adineta steineri]CAF3784048.1 unnamed protein product [Adineta steineri]